MADLVGHVVGSYRLVELRATGSMAEVYKAQRLSDGREVAVKVLSGLLSRDEMFQARFRRESGVVSKLRHPNVLSAIDYGEQEGLAYIVTELVSGGTLQDRLGQPLPVDWTIEIVSQIGDALAYAHSQGIVHRDVKPSNVLLREDGTPVLSDFGLTRILESDAHLTASGVSLGTPAYMSPEQSRDAAVDARSDIYSLGVLLYEMLTGQLPYPPGALGIIQRLDTPPPLPRSLRPDLPAALESVVLKALATKPENRYQCMEDFVDDLRQVTLRPEIPAMERLVGTRLGKYNVIAMTGRGGMADVYKAHQESLDRFVAIKVLPALLARSTDLRRRFRREARAIAALRHPNIVTVYDFGEQGDIVYLVMDYVDGGTLKERMRQPMSLGRAVDIVSQIGGALAYAHQRGIVHRDVKPTNVLMTKVGRPLLADFGLARLMETSAELTQPGRGMGTPAYMAPEQALGMDVSARADIFSLGVMLFEMLTGQLPYHSAKGRDVIRKHISAPPPSVRSLRRDLPREVDRVLRKAMAKEPVDRYQTVDEFLQNLQAAVRARRPIRRWVAAVIVLLTLVGGGGGMAYTQRWPRSFWDRLLPVATLTPTEEPSPTPTDTTTPTLTPTLTCTPTPTDSPTPTPTSTPTATPTPTPTATDTPTSTPTVTPMPTFTPTYTPTFTPTPSVAICTQAAAIFAQPNAESAVLGYVKVGEAVTVIGRAASGSWFYVGNDAGKEGFVWSLYFDWPGYPTTLPTRLPTVTLTVTPTPSNVFAVEYLGCRTHSFALGSVKGQVFDSRGNIIRGALVEIWIDGSRWDDPANPARTNEDGWYEWILSLNQTIRFVALYVDGRQVAISPQGFEVPALSGCFQHVNFRQR